MQFLSISFNFLKLQVSTNINYFFCFLTSKGWNSRSLPSEQIYEHSRTLKKFYVRIWAIITVPSIAAVLELQWLSYDLTISSVKFYVLISYIKMCLFMCASACRCCETIKKKYHNLLPHWSSTFENKKNSFTAILLAIHCFNYSLKPISFNFLWKTTARVTFDFSRPSNFKPCIDVLIDGHKTTKTEYQTAKKLLTYDLTTRSWGYLAGAAMINPRWQKRMSQITDWKECFLKCIWVFEGNL